MKKGTREAFFLLAEASSIGLSLVLATFIGLAVGYYLDQWLGTKPWLIIIFLILGIVAGFKNIYVIARKFHKLADKKTDNQEK